VNLNGGEDLAEEMRQETDYRENVMHNATSRYTVRWPLRHAALSDYYRQISQKRIISAGETYSTICVEWAGDQFGVGLT